jgi:hypothetical protein
MATHDYVIDNQTAPNFRADLNNALAAIVTQNSSATAPTTTYANMFWYETDTNILHIRNESNSAWLDLMVIDQTTGSPSFTAGSVGIGTSSPSALLHVLSTGDTVARVTSGDANTAVLDLGKTSDTDGGRIAYDSGNNLLLYTASTERMRIASAGQIGIGGANYGTSGQVLTSGGSGAAPSWASADSYTHLGTIATTSGSTVTLSGLTLTSYKFLLLVYNVVSFTVTAAMRLAGSHLSATIAASSTASGSVQIDLTNGVAVSCGSTGFVNAAPSGLTTDSTSISLTTSAGNFDAGSVRVYGVK